MRTPLEAAAPLVGAVAFRTDLPGSPGSVEAVADALARSALSALEGAARVTASTRDDVAAEWRGLAAARSHEVLGDLAAHTSEALGELTEIVLRIREYAARLAAAQQALARLRQDARREGLVVTGDVVSTPPGLECQLVPYQQRAEAIYRGVFAAASALGRDRASLTGLDWLMQVPGAASAVLAGRWEERAAGQRARAAAIRAGAGSGPSPAGMDAADEARARGLEAGADDLVRRGAWLGRGTTVAVFPLAVLADRAGGEGWDQAVASQGAGVVTGAAAAGATAAAWTSWTGAGAVLTGIVAFGAGIVGGSVGNAAVDARYEAARRRRTAADMAERCRLSGGRTPLPGPPRPPGLPRYGSGRAPRPRGEPDGARETRETREPSSPRYGAR